MKYYIDTNVIIDLLGQNKKIDDKRESDEEEKERKVDAQLKVKEQLSKILLEDDSELFINRLVLVEALRTIHFRESGKFRKAEKKLGEFRQLEIKPIIYNKAIDFSRFCHSKGVKLKGKCEAIDFLHFITAKHYELKIVSNDADMPKLEEQYVKYIEKK